MQRNDPLIVQDGGVLTLALNDAPLILMAFEFIDALEIAVEAGRDASARAPGEAAGRGARVQLTMPVTLTS